MINRTGDTYCNKCKSVTEPLRAIDNRFKHFCFTCLPETVKEEEMREKELLQEAAYKLHYSPLSDEAHYVSVVRQEVDEELDIG